ncbi:MAG: hypothetical protein P8I03_09745 [Thalassotalea sp.]|nr:hypothetical protein [Thalassotalea sp.]
MHTVDETFKTIITKDEFKESAEHIFTVSHDKDHFRSVVPSPLAEDFAMAWQDEFSAWEWIIHIRENHVSGKQWAIDEPLKCAKCLWVHFGNTPINDNEELEDEFLHFEAGTDKFDVWHWFEEEFNLSIAKDLST